MAVPTRPIRVALVNDYEIVLQGLRALLGPFEPEIALVEMDIRHPPRQRVDVTLLDTYGEVADLRTRVRALASEATNGAVVVFSFSDHSHAARHAASAGARGFISKAVPAREIVEGIKAAARGERVVLTRRAQRAAIDDALCWPGREHGLTERESQLLSLLSTGMTNRELAGHLYVSENTVKTQLKTLYAKLEVRNRAQAAAFAREGFLGRYSDAVSGGVGKSG